MSDNDDDADIASPAGLPDIAQPQWFGELAPGGDGEGFFEKDPRHSLMFVRRARPVLLVTFDNLSNVMDKSPTRVPWAFKFAQEMQLSHLGVLAHGKMWFRDLGLIDRLTALRDGGFFEGYDRVVFAGTSMGAFGALAFCGLAPGAHVLAFNPQSTLNSAIVPWEDRYWIGQRQDWTLPYSDAADCIATAASVSLFHDPYFTPDARHRARIVGPQVTDYKCWYSSHKSAVFLRKIDALKPVMTAGVLGQLTPDMFYRHYRRRRDLRWYAGALEGYYNDRGRTAMAQRCRRNFRKLKRLQA